MKTLSLFAALVLLLSAPGCTTAAPEPAGPDIDLAELNLTGTIEGENITFALAFTAEVARAGAKLELGRGAISVMDSELPGGSKLTREGEAYVLEFTRRGRQAVIFRFAGAAQKNADWRETRFALPAATLRKLAIRGDRPDLEVRFPDALRVEAALDAAAGVKQVNAFLAPGREFAVQWKPQVKKLSGELVVACDANTIATARVGALQLDTLFTYRVVQGSLQKLQLELPEALNVTQVRGADIREWSIDKPAQGPRVLLVALGRPQEKTYVLDVESEIVLSNFPISVDFPVLVPREVIRASGFLLVGADSAIRLTVERAAGLTQIDQSAFPAAAVAGVTRRALPGRSVFAWQYANLPFQMRLSADDIVTAIHAEEQVIVSFEDPDLSLQAKVELDIRDAPAREVTLLTDPKWTVAAVNGEGVSDHDVRDVGGVRQIHVFFREAVLGRALVEVRLERPLPPDATAFEAPVFRVQDAKSERGYVILRGEAGVRLEPGELKDLREVQTASLPVRVAGAQRAYRFKGADWALPVTVKKEESVVHAEVFHLVSLGEGGLYGSASITYNIGGAPARTFKLRIPAECQNVEVIGRDVRGWQQDGDTWTVTLQEKVAGDYTLLVTYSRPATWENGALRVGAIETVGANSETGYIALSGAASLAFDEEVKRDPGILPITPEELPREYALLIKDPVLRAWKYVRAPHTAEVKVKRYAARTLPGQVADHMTLRTRVSREGEAVTEATYFVKNTSGQHFGVRVPQGAKLWSVNVDGQNVQALEDGKGQVLVPVERRRDPNQPLRVTMVYAEQQSKLGWWKRLSFHAPEAAAQSVFAQWSFVMPAKHRVVATSGNLMPPAVPPSGLPALGPAVRDVARAFVRRGLGWAGAGLVVAAVGALLAWNRGRRRAWGVSTWIALVLGLFALAAIVAVEAHFMFWRAIPVPLYAPAEWAFTKPVTLSEGGLEVALTIVPRWVALAGWGVRLALGLVVAAMLFAGRRRPGARGALAGAAALTVLVAAAAGVPVLLPWCAAVVVFALPAALIAAWWRGAAACGARRYDRALALAISVPPAPPAEPPAMPPASYADRIPDPVPETPPGTDEAKGGFGTIGILLALAALSLGLFAADALAAKPQPAPTPPPQVEAPAKPAAPAPEPPPPPPPPVPKVERAEIVIEAPDVKGEPPRNAKVTVTMDYTGVRGGRLLVLPPAFVLTGYTIETGRARFTSQADGCHLSTEREEPGRIKLTYLTGVEEKDGAWRANVWLPASVRNQVSLRVPGTGWEIQSAQAVFLKSEEKTDAVEAKLILGTPGTVELSWRPRERRTDTEKTVFFCEVSTYVLFQPGLVNLTHLIRYQIAQGEVQSLNIDIPEGLSVTAVTGPGLSTWRFDAEKRRLEALLEKPVSGEYVLTVVEQASRDSLPYEIALQEPVVQGAARQRGSIAMAATESVQLRVDDSAALSAMNIADFSADAAQAALKLVRQGGGAPEVKRAFRYHQLPAGSKVSAERVLPEIRVVEESAVDLSDERIKLTSRLAMAIARAGVFSVRLDLPEGFDLDTLTGDDVSHWDEIKDDTGRGVTVHFVKQALGPRTLNLGLSRAGRGVAETVTVPRLAVREALKHTGTLVVSGERGVRFSTTSREGVSEINPRELGVQQPGYLAYRLLRPGWTVTLKTEVLAPVVKAESVQRVDVSEGMLVYRAWVQYAIEHAGVKLFRVRAPRPGMALTFSGKNIARAQETDPTNGVWEIELHGKVEQAWALEISGQTTFDHQTNAVGVAGVQTLDTESQKGWLTVFAGGRLRVQAPAAAAGLLPDDPRGIPPQFGAGDLSGAVLCYRVARPDAVAELSVVRHESAELLAARVEHVRLTTVVSDDDQRVTQVRVELQPGALRFLEMNLPAGGEVWAVFVNDRPIVPLLEGKTYMIPLEAGGGGATVVECLYGEPKTAGRAHHARRYEGPSFNLPLADIRWDFYLPPQYHYRGFDGTLRRIEGEGDGAVVLFGAEDYRRFNDAFQQRNVQKAEEVLQQGNKFWAEGRKDQAKQALEEAILYSQGQKDLNEDARVQYRSQLRQQAVVGLANRRAALKVNLNTAGADESALLKGFNGGNWSAEYGQRVEQSLGTKDNDTLNRVAEKLIEQQTAAGTEVRPIRITMPVQGRRIAFQRALQIQPGAPMVVTFTAGVGNVTRVLASSGLALGLLLIFGLAARLARGRRG